MNWFEPVWLYCERGTSGQILAEPVNALSTLSLVIAGLAGLWMYKKLPLGQRSADHLLLIALAVIAGLGGLAFHLFAAQWSELAHLLPLLFFVMVYLAFALNRFLRVPPGATSLAIGLFVLVTMACLTMTCVFLDRALQPAWSIIGEATDTKAIGATSCLNGSFAYFPALMALFALALWTHKRRHKSAKSLFFAAFLLLGAMVFHTIDHLTCSVNFVSGYKAGTHFIWHLLVGACLFILLRTAMRHQDKRLVREIIPPDAKHSKKSQTSP
ncbi:MAG: hypothetical protein GY927_04585 [bacterium]|nr:hypothetical protein [bacterium]